MKIRKFNESLNHIKYEGIDFFDIIVEKIKPYKGYTVFHISRDDNYCQIFNFKTKEDFEKEFHIDKHPYYPGNCIIPNQIEEESNQFDTCFIGGQEYMLDISNIYLVIDGKVYR